MKLRDFIYIIRKDFKSYLNSILTVARDYPNVSVYKKNNSIPEKIERFTPGKINFNNYEINYLDFPSYESTIKELFDQKIYLFKSKINNPFIIDCGANIGLSVLFFKLNYPKSKIIAFEADPKVFNCLYQNVKSFGFQGIDLINRALWKEKTTLDFYSEGADGGRLGNEIKEINNIVKVDTILLSEYLSQPVDFLKIDIEGAEHIVLEECEQYLKNVKNIFVEYHSFSGKPQVLDKILTILKNNGFRVYINSIGVRSTQPFENINSSLGMDNQLNIFGYRDDNN